MILTQAGADEIEAAYQAGSVVSIVAAAFGDGGGAPVVVSPSATALVGRFGEVPLSAGETVEGMIGGMAIIPCADYPGRVVREFGLESESGTLIAYGAYPDTYLPGQSDSVIKELIVKFVMPLVHAQSVTLVVDPSIAILTQENGDKRYYRRSLRLQEVQDEGAAAQQELRENIGCGTAATKDWGYLSGKLLPHGAYGIGNYTPLPGPPTEGGNTLESMAMYTGFYAHKGGYNTQGYGYGMPSELADGEDYAVIAVKASAQTNMVFGLVWADDGLWFDTLDQGMAGRKKWARVFSDRHPPSAAQTGALPIGGGRLTGNLEIYAPAPILQLTESDTGKEYFLVVDGGNIRLDEDGTSGNNVWSWTSATNTLSVNGKIVPSDYGNFDTRYQAKGDYTPAGQAYTKAESDARYVTGIRQGTEGGFVIESNLKKVAPDGSYVMGYYYEGDKPSGDTMYYRALQVKINNVWMNTGYNTALLSAPESVRAIPKAGLSSLSALTPCRVEVASDAGPEIIEGIADYVDENGYLWSVASRALAGSIFIGVDDAGIIRQIDSDATMLRPDGLSVYGLDALPDGCTIDGKWIFDGNDVTPAPVNYAAEAEKLKARLMRDAEAIIAPLQRAVKHGLATDAEKQLLEEWEVYTVLLSRVDMSKAPDIEWPPVPA
nr:tail fiber assembly protein [Lelliottia amnigena]